MIETKLNSQEFNKLVTGFEQELKKEDKSENYTTQHTSRIKEFLCYVEANGIHAIKGIEQPTVSNYVLYMEQERMNLKVGGTLTQSSINQHKNAIRKFWKYLDAERIQAKAIWMKQKKNVGQAETTVLTEKEIEQLFSVCDGSALGYRDRAMLAIYYGCGMRKSEGQRLLLTDFDFNNKRIHVRKSKNNRERYVVMSPMVQQIIEEYFYSYRGFYLPEQSDQEAFFISERGTALTGVSLAHRISMLWSKVIDTYGSDKHIGLHTLRHTLGTHLYTNKKDIEMIALMLGHRTLEATKLYIHLANLIKR